MFSIITLFSFYTNIITIRTPKNSFLNLNIHQGVDSIADEVIGFDKSFTQQFLSNYWQPLTWISHIIDFNIFKMDAGGHHLTSLFFHLINILLVLIFFNKVTNNFWISSFVALFFALHPIHVESVAWISERKDVLSTFFLLMTLNLYLQYAKKRITNGKKTNKKQKSCFDAWLYLQCRSSCPQTGGDRGRRGS